MVFLPDLEDVKKHLNITTTDQDDELSGIVYAASTAIEKRVGPLEPTTVTATVVSDGWSLILPVVPVLSLTTVVPQYGSDIGASGFFLGGAAGVATPLPGTALHYGVYTVTYEAGYDYPPDDLMLAIYEMVRHLWKPQRGAAARPGSPDMATNPGYLIPNMVAELIEPYLISTVAGFA